MGIRKIGGEKPLDSAIVSLPVDRRGDERELLCFQCLGQCHAQISAIVDRNTVSTKGPGNSTIVMVYEIHAVVGQLGVIARDRPSPPGRASRG